EHHHRVYFFREYDRDSEAPQRLAGKLAGYLGLAQASQIATPLLWWLPTPAPAATPPPAAPAPPPPCCGGSPPRPARPPPAGRSPAPTCRWPRPPPTPTTARPGPCGSRCTP